MTGPSDAGQPSATPELIPGQHHLSQLVINALLASNSLPASVNDLAARLWDASRSSSALASLPPTPSLMTQQITALLQNMCIQRILTLDRLCPHPGTVLSLFITSIDRRSLSSLSNSTTSMLL